jgi:anti-sigma-K factor RskA
MGAGAGGPISREHDRYADDLAAFLLDALTPEERRDFEQHLSSCDVCRAELRWMRAAVEVLPLSVEQVEAPPALRERLVDTVRAEASSAAAPRPRRPAARFADRFRLSLRPAAALASVAIVAAGIAGYLIGNGGDEGPSRVAVSPTAVEPAARATIERTDAGAVLRAERLPVQPRGHVYEVWIVRKGKTKPEPSSLFAVHRDGRGATAIPGDLGEVETVLVSLEPEGGSAEPSTKPILRAKL